LKSASSSFHTALDTFSVAKPRAQPFEDFAQVVDVEDLREVEAHHDRAAIGDRSTRPRCWSAAIASRMRVRGTPNSVASSTSRSFAPGAICCCAMRLRSASKISRAPFRETGDRTPFFRGLRHLPTVLADPQSVNTYVDKTVDGSENGPVMGPLTGYRVLEMGSTVAGPFCGRLLADFGAEVVKVEPAEGRPRAHDGQALPRQVPVSGEHLPQQVADLRGPAHAEGQDVIRRVASQCDVVVENFRPGGLEKWGLGIRGSLEGQPGARDGAHQRATGQDGPYASRAGYGVIGEAISGLRHVTGDPDRPPARIAVSITDYITGLYAAFGAVMALLARGKTGKGQCIDSALYECAFSFMEPHIPAFEKLGIIANRSGSRLPDSTPNNLFVSRDQQFIHITAMGDAVFRRLCGCMGQPELADDARFANGIERSHNHEALDDLIAAWCAKHDLAELERVLHEAGVPATRIYTIADIFATRTTRRAAASSRRPTRTSARSRWRCPCLASRPRPAPCATRDGTSARTRAGCSRNSGSRTTSSIGCIGGHHLRFEPRARVRRRNEAG
jgi:crotonobetainyl-CoA:carnitine CoA-transferase CaiB-like acyl-CoA transferase